jgi:heme-degrading monooxygenase HmoA
MPGGGPPCRATSLTFKRRVRQRATAPTTHLDDGFIFKFAATNKNGETQMIKVHIKRKVPSEKMEALRALINELRSLTMGQPGYIAGETLQRVDQPGESLVVAKWQSVDYWQQWEQSKARSEIQGKIDRLLGEETIYEIYEYD